MEQEKVKKITAGWVLSWLAGIIVLFMAITPFVLGQAILGIIIIRLGLLIIPNSSNMIAEKFKIEISGGIKFILLIVAIALNSSAMSSFLNDSSDKVSNSGGEVSSNLVVDDGAITEEKKEEKIGCPNITKEADKYNIHYGQSDGGHTNLYLSPSFVLEMEFSDGFELYNKPNVSNEYLYASESFICETGSEQGQSINKVYCEPSFMYEPMLEKKIIDSDGNIVKTERREIEYFIFDASGKDLNNANDLQSLELEKMTCQ